MEEVLFCKKCHTVDKIFNFINNNLCIKCFETSSNDKKICKDCKVKKKLCEFYKNITFKDARSNSCTECANSKYKKINIKIKIEDDNFYDEFIKNRIEKTENLDDKLIATDLFKEYKKYLKLKHYRSDILPQFFKKTMLNENYLGEQIGNCWRGYKLLC